MKRPPPGPLDYLRRWPLQLWLIIVGLFLYLPLITLVAFSFNDSKRNIVWRGFTTDWYVKALTNESMLTAFGNSLTIAALSTMVSVVLGALAAVALWRFNFRGKALFEGGMALPIVVPEICMGVAMLVFFARVLPWPQDVGWPLNLGPIVIAHISFSFPFVAVVVRARLHSFDRSQEEAARDLGASPWQTFYHVLLPMIAPSLIGVGLFGFSLSYDEFARTLLTSGSFNTLPLEIYGMTTNVTTPVLYALGTVTTVFSFLIIGVTIGLIALVSGKRLKA